ANGHPATVTEVACWAHVRRYFYDIHVASNAPIADEALQRIGLLFDVERTAMGRSPEQRQLIRQRSARPVMDELARFLDAPLATQLDRHAESQAQKSQSPEDAYDTGKPLKGEAKAAFTGGFVPYRLLTWS